MLKHAVLLDARTLFASGAMPPTDVARAHDTSIDLRLSSRSQAVDAAQALSGWNDGFRGLRPDLGAYELGDSPPHYGPRDYSGPQKVDHSGHLHLLRLFPFSAPVNPGPMDLARGPVIE